MSSDARRQLNNWDVRLVKHQNLYFLHHHQCNYHHYLNPLTPFLLPLTQVREGGIKGFPSQLATLEAHHHSATDHRAKVKRSPPSTMPVLPDSGIRCAAPTSCQNPISHFYNMTGFCRLLPSPCCGSLGACRYLYM